MGDVRIWNRSRHKREVQRLIDAGTAVYVGRPTKWGNPWSDKPSAIDSVLLVPTRETAIWAFTDFILSDDRRAVQLRADARRELRGKDLVCWCAPDPCHADLWRDIAHSPDDTALGL